MNKNALLISKTTSEQGHSPHVWGSVHGSGGGRLRPAVFPTRVGVYRSLRRTAPAAGSLPHTRGGLSYGPGYAIPDSEVLPAHPWGSLHVFRLFSRLEEFFPTCVGVCLADGSGLGESRNTPHVPWGSARRLSLRPEDPSVLPTDVGVSPHQANACRRAHRLPHACGGLSIEAIVSGLQQRGLQLGGRRGGRRHTRPRHTAPLPAGAVAARRHAAPRTETHQPLPHCGKTSLTQAAELSPRVARSRSRDAPLGHQQAHPDPNLPDTEARDT